MFSQGHRLAVQKLLHVNARLDQISKYVPDDKCPMPPSWRRKFKIWKGPDEMNAVLLQVTSIESQF